MIPRSGVANVTGVVEIAASDVRAELADMGFITSCSPLLSRWTIRSPLPIAWPCDCPTRIGTLPDRVFRFRELVESARRLAMPRRIVVGRRRGGRGSRRSRGRGGGATAQALASARWQLPAGGLERYQERGEPDGRQWQRRGRRWGEWKGEVERRRRQSSQVRVPGSHDAEADGLLHLRSGEMASGVRFLGFRPRLTCLRRHTLDSIVVSENPSGINNCCTESDPQVDLHEQSLVGVGCVSALIREPEFGQLRLAQSEAAVVRSILRYLRTLAQYLNLR